MVIATETQGHGDAQTEPNIFLCSAVQKNVTNVDICGNICATRVLDIYEQLNFFPSFLISLKNLYSNFLAQPPLNNIRMHFLLVVSFSLEAYFYCIKQNLRHD